MQRARARGKGQKSVVVTKQLLPSQVQGSTLVDTTDKFQSLATLLEEDARSLRLETLYSTRISGWTDSAAFHGACDSKGPTLTLIVCSDGVGYGGYTSISWTSDNQYHADAKAFLFRIANFGTKQAAEKFSGGDGKMLYGNPTYGPTFGGGHDLLTFSSSGQMLTCHASTYSSDGPLIPATVPRAATISHMEVLLVNSGTSGLAEELEAPWLTGCSWSIEVQLLCSSDVDNFSDVA